MQMRVMVFLLVGSLSFLGCSPSRKIGGDVKGSVELAGKPINYGAITIIGQDKHTSMSEIENGQYHLKQTPFGTCEVIIVTSPPIPFDADMSIYKPPADYMEVPARYGRPETSKLEMNVTEAAQDNINFKLTP